MQVQIVAHSRRLGEVQRLLASEHAQSSSMQCCAGAAPWAAWMGGGGSPRGTACACLLLCQIALHGGWLMPPPSLLACWTLSAMPGCNPLPILSSCRRPERQQRAAQPVHQGPALLCGHGGLGTLPSCRHWRACATVCSSRLCRLRPEICATLAQHACMLCMGRPPTQQGSTECSTGTAQPVNSNVHAGPLPCRCLILGWLGRWRS